MTSNRIMPGYSAWMVSVWQLYTLVGGKAQVDLEQFRDCLFVLYKKTFAMDILRWVLCAAASGIVFELMVAAKMQEGKSLYANLL